MSASLPLENELIVVRLTTNAQCVKHKALTLEKMAGIHID